MDCADVEFGRLQARDLLQHLWTGPISNAPVNIVQGSKSVEVRPVGISKVRRILVPDPGVAVLIDSSSAVSHVELCQDSSMQACLLSCTVSCYGKLCPANCSSVWSVLTAQSSSVHV